MKQTMLLKKNLSIFCLLFFQACHGMENNPSINAIILSPNLKLKNYRTNSLQEVIQKIIKGNDAPNNKYKHLKTEKPKPSGLFKLLENVSSLEVTFLTSLEPSQKYIDLLGNIEFLVTKNLGHNPIVFFNLVELEKIILDRQRMYFEQLILFSEPYEKLKQEIENLKKNLQEKKVQVQNYLDILKQSLNDEEEEQKKEPLLAPIFKNIQELQKKNSSANSEIEPNIEKWIESILLENQNLQKSTETLTEELGQTTILLENNAKLLSDTMEKKFLQEIEILKIQIREKESYLTEKETECNNQKIKNQRLERQIQNISQSLKEETKKLFKTIEDLKIELVKSQQNHLQKLTKKEDKQEQQLATYRFYSIFTGIGLFFSGFGLQWLYNYLTNK